jgi:hypothetical protein
VVLKYLLSIPRVRKLIEDNLDQQASSLDIDELLRNFIEYIRKRDTMWKAAGDGQVKGLKRLLDEKVIPKSFTPKYWNIISCKPRSVILGDSCVIATADNQTGSLFRFGESWQVIYVPISHSQILVAKRGETCRELTVDEVNRASAQYAVSHLFASDVNEYTAVLTPLIGTDKIVNDREIEYLIRDIWQQSSDL